MNRSRRPVLLFGAGAMALLICAFSWSSRASCEDHGMYVACMGKEGGNLRVEFRNRSSQALLLFKDRFAYRVSTLGLFGYAPTAYDESEDAGVRMRDFPKDAVLGWEHFDVLKPGGSYALLLPPQGPRDRGFLGPLMRYRLELRRGPSTTDQIPAWLQGYPLIDLSPTARGATRR